MISKTLTICGFGLAIVVSCSGSAWPLMPKNPERAFTARTCTEALDRLEEAFAGSPLIDENANRRVLEQAVAQTLKLCREK